jgi:hypothetical protein
LPTIAFYTDFNTGKLYGATKRKFREKNIFAEKYDEIRRLDGTGILPVTLSLPAKGWYVYSMQI